MARYDAYKPEVLSRELLTNRERMSVFKNLCYKGPILGEITKKGDILHIAGVGRPTVRNYTIGSEITLEDKIAYSQDLRITEAKYINVNIEDIDNVQVEDGAKIRATEILEAKRALAQTADEFIADLYSQAGATVTDSKCTSTSILDTLMQAETKLLEADVNPDEEMNLVVSPRIYGKIMLAKIIFQTPNSDAIKSKGWKGSVLNFNTYVSNSINNNDSTIDYCMAFTNQALAFAEQIPASGIKEYEPEKKFSKAFKVLHLYGATVIRPAELVCITTTYTAEE